MQSHFAVMKNIDSKRMKTLQSEMKKTIGRNLQETRRKRGFESDPSRGSRFCGVPPTLAYISTLEGCQLHSSWVDDWSPPGVKS